MDLPVSLYVNCFERDYRTVLTPGFMKAKADQFCYPFRRTVVLINNVRERDAALSLAQEAVGRGEIGAFVEVAEALPAALERCGLSERDLGVVKHYIDFALVAVTHSAPDYLLYCCAEVDLVHPCNWITPAIRRLQENPRFLVANPSWQSDPGGAEREAIRREGDHWVGQGFSDQCFLVHADRLAQPVYCFTHPAGERYPMSDLGDIFEKRIDAYMRREGLLRLTDASAFYRHQGKEGEGYPEAPLWLRIRKKASAFFGSPARTRPGHLKDARLANRSEGQ